MSLDPRPDAARSSSVRRRAWIFGGVGLAATATGLGLGWWSRRSETTAIAQADALWEKSFQTLDGPALPLASLRGKPLLVNFWATWCPPCVEELPLLDRFAQANKAKGWQVLGLAADQEAPVRGFLQRVPLSFPVALAGFPGIELSKVLGNVSGALPFTVVLGSDGNIVQRRIGQVTTTDLQAWATMPQA
jgi:thiol-disulfide isomerase/thioredoxin